MASRLKPVRMVAMFAAGVVVCGLQANEAWSQGILRRIQERVQSRVPPAAPQGQTAPQGQAARPSASDAATQRLSPIDATTDESTQSEDSAGRSEQRARFGGSILSRPRVNQGQGNRPLVAQRASLGIRVVPLTEGSGGLRVAGIRSGSRAADAGLQVDDVIVSVEGRPTPNAETLAEVLRSKKAGEPVLATVMRGEQARELEIPLVDSAAIAALKSVAAEVANSGLLSELTQPAPEASAAELGVTVADIGGGRGVLVQEVVPGSTAQSAGLQLGDRIVSLNGRLVRDVEALQRELSSRRVGDVVSVNAVRNDTLNAYEVELQSRTAESLPRNVAAAGTQSTGRQSNARATGLPGNGDTAQASGAGTPAGSQPILDGLRSALGGFLNRTPANAAQSPATDPLGVADGEPVKRVGFDEEITQPSNAPSASEATSPLDPPSIEELAPPAGEVDADSTRSGDLQSLEPPAESSLPGDTFSEDTFSGDKDQLIRDLQERVRQLQQRIRELEAARP